MFGDEKISRDMIKISEAANILGESVQNLRRWHEEFPPAKITPKGTRFYSRKVLEDYMKNKSQEEPDVQHQ